jgi:hypothetical protein
MKKKLLLACFPLLMALQLEAQTRWQKYDSIYHENLFQPNFSNLLMPKGYTEVLINNSLISSNGAWNAEGDAFDILSRYTYYYETSIVNTGLSKSGRFNGGLEVHVARAYVDSEPESSPLNIFKKSPRGFIDREQAVSSIGPRIKWRPFKHNLNFVYTSTLQVSLLNDDEDQNLLVQSHLSWGNQFLYSIPWGKKLIFFAQDDLYFNSAIDKSSNMSYYNGLTLYGYLLINKHLFPFASVGYNTILEKSLPTAQFMPVGLGLQYQYSMRFTLNVYYSRYAWAKNYLDWHTLNLGVRGVF